ncbi:MAG: electron transfer flavoprotein subunit alpha/FixB family protein [Salibacteraceae bacterium]
MSVLVFADSNDGKVVKSAFEAVTYGSKVASSTGGHCEVVTYGNVDNDQLTALGNYGATKVSVDRSVSDFDPNRLARLVGSQAEALGSDTIVIFSHDYTGKSVAPMAAAHLIAGLVAGAIDYPNTDGGFTVKKAVFSGKAYAHFSINTGIKVISLLPNSISVEKGDGAAEVAEISPDLGDSRLRVKEVRTKGGDGILLTAAELVDSAGRGLKGPENWGMIEELAQELGAATACSRPVSDIGWRPHHEHVGQTGIAIRPNLYIAVGISGAIQHLAGVNGSKTIVVINTDPEAPFFKAADYGIVGDAFEVVPKLLSAVRNHKAALN